MKPSGNRPDTPDYNINFLTGINWLLVSNYKQAIHFFLIAVIETDASDPQYYVYQSYAGLSSVLMHEIGGLHHCYNSSKSRSIHPEVQLNLACAEFFAGNRARGIKALDGVEGLPLSPVNAEEIQAFFDIVGKRANDAHGKMKREKFAHKYIGKIFRKKPVAAQIIEEFIIETARKRYESVMSNLQKSQPILKK